MKEAESLGQAFEKLVAIISRLRDPNGGCPWDIKQTHATLKRHAIEEAYELVEAIDQGPKAIAEELGDVLLQVLLHAQIGSDSGPTDSRFSMLNVVQTLTNKLIHRHPHVFGDVQVKDAEEVLRNWESLKKSEKPERKSLLEGISPALPALLRSHKQGEAVARAGFDWWSAAGAKEKAIEELKEFLEAKDETHAAEELGDLLFSLTQVARKMKLDAETVLQSANAKFQRRFQSVESLAKKPIKELSPEELDKLWNAAKAAEKKA